MKLNYQAYSDIGCVRSNNEDMILVDREFLRDESAEGELKSCAIVADGMGGNDGGELASDIACQEFDTWLSELPVGLSFDQLKASINRFNQAAHSLINRRGLEIEGFAGMGTTLVGFFIYESKVYWLNIGDSRLYLYRGDSLQQVSKDHSYRNLLNDPTQPSNLIYNCLGSGEGYETFVDFEELVLQPGDRLLVCSDGLSDMISDSQIETMLRQNSPASSFISAARVAGGEDNISVITVQVSE